MSGLPPRPDISRGVQHVRQVPIADVGPGYACELFADLISAAERRCGVVRPSALAVLN